MKHIGIRCWVYGCGLVVFFVTSFVFSYVLVKGSKVITWDFLFQYPQGTPLGNSGGIFPAIMGSLYVGTVAAAIAAIFSLSLAVYLTFYCHNRILYEINNFIMKWVSLIPSIVLGLFGYSFFLLNLGIPRSVLSAGMTLAIMIVPFITLRLEKIFREYPGDVVESSLALGVSMMYTLRQIILPQRRREIASAIALGTAYAMGATAPIMYTGTVLYTGHLPELTDPFMSLPFHLYILDNEGYSLSMAYGTAFVLMALLLMIMIACQFGGKERW